METIFFITICLQIIESEIFLAFWPILESENIRIFKLVKSPQIFLNCEKMAEKGCLAELQKSVNLPGSNIWYINLPKDFFVYI